LLPDRTITEANGGTCAAPKFRMKNNHAPLAILVVEDDWLVCENLACELRAAGWIVHETSSGEGALTILQSGQPIDIVITDIHLSGFLSGWDVAEAFRAVHRDIPVVYASGNAVEHARQVCDSRFFSKPYEITRIVDVCRSYERFRSAIPS
jgi:CheY-like chemotaxis protein